MSATVLSIRSVWRFSDWAGPAVGAPSGHGGTLITLPHAFSRLSAQLSKVQCAICNLVPEEPAICLVCGAVLWAGKKAPSTNAGSSSSPPDRRGACTRHAETCANGNGLFFVVQRCAVLLMHKARSAYSISPYVDVHGEEDLGLKRGRPLFLSPGRYDSLQSLWRSHRLPLEVARIRNSSERVIIDSYY